MDNLEILSGVGILSPELKGRFMDEARAPQIAEVVMLLAGLWEQKGMVLLC